MKLVFWALAVLVFVAAGYVRTEGLFHPTVQRVLAATRDGLGQRRVSGETPGGSVAPPCDAADPTRRTVVRVVDGDTVVLDGQEKVRLIGVDTPETVHPTKPVEWFGHEASAFTTQRLAGKVVTLAFDQQRRDRFRRTLAYVCLEGHSVNEEIIQAGYGFAYVKYPFRADLMARFRAAERQAQDAGRGLWARASSSPAGSTGPR